MVNKSLLTIVLLFTWVQSLTMVTAMEEDDMVAFTQPMTQMTSPATSLSKVIPAGGTNELVGGLIPDAKALAQGGPTTNYDQGSEVEARSLKTMSFGKTRALQRRSKEKISTLSGAEQMNRARQGVVVDPQEKSKTLANLKRRMINNLVKNMQEKSLTSN